MRLFSVTVFGTLICCIPGCSTGDAAPTQEDIDHFEALMAQGAQPDLYEVRKAFRKCFKKGQPASRYEKILSKAKKQEHAPGAKGGDSYRWFSPAGDGFSFEVYVAGDPPIIIQAGFVEYDY